MSVTRNLARTTFAPEPSITIHAFPGVTLAVAPEPVYQPWIAGASSSVTNALAVGMSAVVTLSNAASWLAGVMAWSSALVAASLQRRQ